MRRKIIRIDREKCDGCGLCAGACREGAIEIRDGVARLLRDDHCDGLGACLPACPAGAIAFEEREAAAFAGPAPHSPAAREAAPAEAPPASGCPGLSPRAIDASRQWPIQIRLAPARSPHFDGAHLLIAADCSAYVHPDFRGGFMRGRTVLIGCPKLDDFDFEKKIGEILAANRVAAITVARLEVPCCAGLARAAAAALTDSGRRIPLRTATISIEGKIIDEYDG